jgi:hypothetical protein
MRDSKTRLVEAERALQRLELQVEQYRIHVEELDGQSYAAEKARTVLDSMTVELELQRKYCEILANSAGVFRKNARSVA